MFDLSTLTFDTTEAPPPRPGVYVLIDGDEVVYVGQARFNLRGRFAEHFGNRFKEFTRIGWAELPMEQVKEAEDELIRYYLPRYNKALPKGLARQLRENGNG